MRHGIARALTFATVALAACGGEGRAPSAPASPPPAAPAAGVSSPALIDALDQPAVQGEEAEALLRLVVREGAPEVPGTPAVGEPRPPLAERPTGPVLGGPTLYAMFTHRLAAGAPEAKGQTAERLLRVEPWLRLAPDGSATVTFETLRPIPAATVYFGHRLPQDPLGLPRYRQASAAMEDRADVPGGHRYVVRLDSTRVLRPRYDAAGVLHKKRGVLAWRLEMLDALEGTSRVIDGETAFRCDPCQGPDRAFVQLPSLRLGPFVDRVGTSSAIVSFATDAATAGYVAVYAEGSDAELLGSPAPGTRHEVVLEGLEPGTRYRYQPVVVDARGEVHVHRGGTIETEPEDLTRFELVALSDSRSGHGPADTQYGGTNAEVLRGLLQGAIARGRPRAIVFVGDLIDGYTTWPRSYVFELEMWQRAVQPVHAHLPIYEVMGNHEALLDVWANGWAAAQTRPSAESLFAEAFVNPPGGPEAAPGAPPYRENTYSFDLGHAHLVALNSNYRYRSHPGQPGHPAGPEGNREGWLDDATLAWLDADLAAAREAGQQHLFVFAHEPAFPNGGHVQDGLYWNGEVPEVLAQRAKLYGILGRHGVTAIVHGDEHNYSRLLVDAETLGAPMDRPVWQLISGGAGAPYYAQDREVPWSAEVAAFDTRQHYLRILVDGARCTIEAVSREGGRIDRFDATSAAR